MKRWILCRICMNKMQIDGFFRLGLEKSKQSEEEETDDD
jgi:hypothetical protein